MSDYYILITDAGVALEASAHAAGTTVKLDKFGVCDGGVDFIPDPAATTFANEVFQSDISSLTVSADDATVMVAQCIIPGTSGGYTIRGIAIYTDDGTLYATGNYPAQPKPAPDSGFAASLEILAQLAVSDTADVSLTVTEGNFLTETQGNTLYLRQDKRLSEIAAAGAEAQSAARDNLALGTAATATLTTSTTDSSVGRVLKVGDRNLGLPTIMPTTGFDFNLYQFSAGETIFVQMSSAINVPPALEEETDSYLYLNVIGVRDTRNDSAVLITSYQRNIVYLANRFTPSSEELSWSVINLTNFLPLSGGEITGPLTIDSDDVPLAIRNKTQDGKLRLVGENADGISRWYLGNGVSGDETLHLVNLFNGSGIRVNADGSVSIVPTNNVLLDIEAAAEAQYFEATQSPGAGSYAGQYNVKAPYYKEFSDSGSSVYHPLWKMKALTNGVMWSGGVIVSEGNFVIHYIDSVGATRAFNFNSAGEFIPDSYANFDARYQRANTASLANPGWFKDTNTGLITQWGWKDGVGGPNCLVNLPIAFPSDISSVQVTYQSVGGREYSPSVHNQGLSSFQVDCDNDGNAIYWVAIGR